MATKSQHEPSLWILLLGIFIKTILYAFLGCFISLLIGIVLMVLQPHDHVLHYLNQLLQSQLVFLHKLDPNYPIIFQPGSKANFCINKINEWLIVKTQAQGELAYLQEAKTMNSFLKVIIKKAYPIAKDYLQLLISIIQLNAVKIIEAILYLPLYGVLGIVGIIDGLVQRKLRRLRALRESALIYHRARDCVVPTFILGFFIYLLLPLGIRPENLLVPFALLFALSISMTVRTFKKYL